MIRAAIPLNDRASFLFIARAIAVRLRLSRMLRRRSLPDLLRALTPESAPRSRSHPLPSHPLPSHPLPSHPLPSHPLPTALDAIESAERLLNHLPAVPNTCLYRALGCYAVLRAAGHPAYFFMAIDPKSRDIEGHAWVEIDGAPLLEAVDPRLIVTYSYPESAPPRAKAA